MKPGLLFRVVVTRMAMAQEVAQLHEEHHGILLVSVAIIRLL